MQKEQTKWLSPSSAPTLDPLLLWLPAMSISKTAASLLFYEPHTVGAAHRFSDERSVLLGDTYEAQQMLMGFLGQH